MSGKRRHNEREDRLKALAEKTRMQALASGVAVDVAVLAPNNSYGRPDFVERGYYVDKPFVCQACGVPETWTAAQQKWWYEVAKGHMYSTARLCRPCRQRERAQRVGGDPNPHKNPGLLLAKVCADLEPNLLLAGYRPAGRSNRGARRRLFVDYGRSDDLFTFSWDPHYARLVAEVLAAEDAAVRVIATADFSGVRSTSEIQDRLKAFTAAVGSILNGSGESTAEAQVI